ncbi:hypothetical protein [Halorubrum sp. HHNYT27]|uniref:hypothetical protein n=1 Tax=Halorubrum sp. HHNYT27 TaxID=3402275 RepID=UPI003EB799C2
MPKTSSQALLADIADDFHTYLRKGVRFDRVIDTAHPDLDVDDIETLLRIHFVLTDAGDTDESVGVLDFMRTLEDRIRQMKTTVSATSVEQRGEIRGRIDWPETTKRRARAGRFDEPLFVCRQPEERYDVDENLVLKRLLRLVHEIVHTDLQPAVENPDGYEWLSEWVKPADDASRSPESAAARLNRIYERNIYLQRIEEADKDVTDRTIESVKRSRSAFYRDAAILLDRYRRLMNQELDSDEARDILAHTVIAPEETETLFELYWIFRILDAYDAVEYRVLTHWRNDPSTVATWEQDGSRFVISHDATGESLTFRESLDPDAVEPDGYLFRLNQVLTRWKSLSQDLLDYSASDSLWGGRPDILLQRYDRDETGEFELAHVFVGEVKYTQNIGYVATGLRELLEYMAFVKRSQSGAYVEAPEDVLNSVSVRGLLFTDDLDQETQSPDEIEIVQYSDSFGQVL